VPSDGFWPVSIELRFTDGVIEADPAAVLAEVGELAVPIDPPPYPLRMPPWVYVL
jgi:hypothetical protein